jgi:hypothetical protein
MTLASFTVRASKAAAAFTATVMLLAATAPAASAQTAVLRGLDKVTGHTRDFNVTIGRTQKFGTLDIIARACTKSDPVDPPEVKVFVEIFDTPAPRDPKAEPKRTKIKEGWLFASTPGLNALDHATYDVWPIDCKR